MAISAGEQSSVELSMVKLQEGQAALSNEWEWDGNWGLTSGPSQIWGKILVYWLMRVKNTLHQSQGFAL